MKSMDPLQCMHSVHCSVYPVYTLIDTGTGLGLVALNLVLLCYIYSHNPYKKEDNTQVYNIGV